MAALFEQAFKNIDDVLWKEAGCTTELDYTEQTSWLLFLKYLDDLEKDRATVAKLEGKRYAYILEPEYRWESWAAPKAKDGKLDHNRAMTGDDLLAFVNGKLFPYLHGFKQRAESPDTIEYKIGEIFGEIKNKIQSGYNLREIIDHVDELRFRSQAEKHELSHLYEAKIRNMGNAGRNGGEYYTPRPLIRAIVNVVDPKVGERVYDGAVGSAGFLCEAFDYMKAKSGLTTKDLRTLQEKTFFGKEKKSLAYVIAIMNMILHGIEAPNILHTNTLTENLADIQEKDRVDVILANPPFGGKERKEVQQNFPIRTGETAYLFLQHFIKRLRAGGRAGIIIKSTFFSNDDAASFSMRKLLFESCDVHTIIDVPRGAFSAGVHTVAIFFTKGTPTKRVWIYRLDPGRNLGKTNPLNDADLADFVSVAHDKPITPHSSFVSLKDLDPATYVLPLHDANNPDASDVPDTQAIAADLKTTLEQAETRLASLERAALSTECPADGWTVEELDSLCEIELGRTPARDNKSYWDSEKETGNVWLSIADLLNADNYVVSDSKEYISDKGAALSRVVKQGTLLVSFKLTLGRLAFAGCDLFTNEAIAALTIRDEKKLSKKYLFHFLQFFDWEKAAEGDEKVKGKTLNKAKLKALKIHYPPRKEQDRIVSALEAAHVEMAQLESLVEQSNELMKPLRLSVLHRAFGNHR